MNFSVEKIGAILLAVIVLVAVILFILSGVGTQSSVLNETSQNIISNLTESVENAR